MRLARGITLVEILVALALTALLLGAVGQLIVRGHRLERELHQTAQASARIARPLDILRSDLQQLPLSGSLQLTGEGLRYVTLQALQSSRPTLRSPVEVRHTLEPDPDGRSRWIRYESPPGKVAGAASPLMLAQDLRGLSFAVWDGHGWESRWPPPTPRTALALRISTESASGQTHSAVIPLRPLRWRSHR